jgi:hypothetical protein
MPAAFLPTDPQGAMRPMTEQEARSRRIANATGYGSYGLLPVEQYVQTLSSTLDENEHRYGPRVYEYAMDDPPIGGSIGLLKRAGLRNDPTAIRDEELVPEGAAEDDLASEIVDLCNYATARMDDPLQDVLYDLGDGMQYGTKLAELTWTYPEVGAFRSRLVPRALDVKPRGSWRFVVDRFLKVQAIEAQTPEGPLVVPPDKCAWLTWGKRDGDPRGTSVSQGAIQFWNFRAQLLPDHFLFCKRFAAPFAWAQLPPENEQPATTVRGKTPEDQALEMLEAIRNGACGVIANGGSFNFAEASGKGEAFLAALDHYARLEVWSILLQVRATMESENGSRADSETGAGVLENMLNYVTAWFARFVEWNLYYRIVLYNYGRDVADRLTPKCSMGKVGRKDLIAFMQGITGLYNAGFIVPSQYQSLDAEFGLPIRDDTEVQKAQELRDNPPPPPPVASPNEETGDSPDGLDPASPKGGVAPGKGKPEPEAEAEA